MRTWIGVVIAAVLSLGAQTTARAVTDDGPLLVVVTPFDLHAAGNLSADTREAVQSAAGHALSAATDPAKVFVLPDDEASSLLEARELPLEDCGMACRRLIAHGGHADVVLTGRVFLRADGPAVQLRLFVVVTGRTFIGDPERADTPQAIPSQIEQAMKDLLVKFGDDALHISFTDPDTYGWGVLTASIQPKGTGVVGFEAGTLEGTSVSGVVSLVYGLTGWFDLGVKVEGNANAPSNLRFPARLRLKQGSVYAMAWRFEPGVYFNIDPTRDSLPPESFYLDTGLQFGFRVAPRAEFGFAVDARLWYGSSALLGASTYADFEYALTPRACVGIKAGFGEVIGNNTSGVIPVASLTFGLRL